MVPIFYLFYWKKTKECKEEIFSRFIGFNKLFNNNNFYTFNDNIEKISVLCLPIVEKMHISIFLPLKVNNGIVRV